jgi:diadenosine tetraphosphate (Ap4A) HIT family hydrolase
MADSIFTKIIKGEITAHKIYEDDKTIVIIPLHTVAKGHVLVIPKLEVDQFIDLPDEDYKALWDTVKKVGRKMRDVLKTQRIGLQVIGTDVPHAHIHVIAFDTTSEYYQRTDESKDPDHQKNAEMAKKLAF